MTCPAVEQPIGTTHDTGYRPWVAWARLVAITGIVTIHVCGHLVLEWRQVDATLWHFGNLMESATRFGVPVFVLLSGALLLDPARTRTESVSWFYRRRAARIAVPLVVWTVFYLWFDAWTRGVEVTPYTFFQGFLWGRPYYHLYFLYIVAGLYLITPFLRVFVAHASRRLVGCATAVCLGLAIADKAQHTVLGGGGFNAFSYFVPWIGYYLLGYLATTWTPRAPARTVAVWSGVAYVGGVLVTAVGSWLLFGWYGVQNGRVLYDYFAPAVLLTAVAVVLFLRAVTGDVGPAVAMAVRPSGGALVRRFGDLAFGVFLLHPLPLQLFVRSDQPRFDSALVDAAFHVGVIVALLVGCGLVTAGLRRVPVARRLV